MKIYKITYSKSGRIGFHTVRQPDAEAAKKRIMEVYGQETQIIHIEEGNEVNG